MGACASCAEEWAKDPGFRSTTIAVLASCPFCGGEAQLEHLESGSWSPGCIEAGGEPCVAFQMLSTYSTQREAITAWNTRPAIVAALGQGEVRSKQLLALQAIKAVTATTKDAVAGLSRIMSIARNAGVPQSYTDLLADPDVALLVNEPRTVWQHLLPTSPAPPAPDERDDEVSDPRSENANETAFAVGQVAHEDLGVTPELRRVVRMALENGKTTAIDKDDDEVSRLRAALKPFAEQKTIVETLHNPERPAWFGYSPERRVQMIGEQREKHDAAILNARAALSPAKGGE